MAATLDLTKDQALETYKSMISIGTEALKALQLINGGAIVAILAYLGKTPDSSKAAPYVEVPIALFVSGLVAATLAFLTTYLTQYYLFNDLFEQTDPKQRHVPWLVITVVISFASLILFACGALKAVKAFGHV
jgi:phosphate/sulfate permease